MLFLAQLRFFLGKACKLDQPKKEGDPFFSPWKSLGQRSGRLLEGSPEGSGGSVEKYHLGLALKTPLGTSCRRPKTHS